jgi:hypothetical protein
MRCCLGPGLDAELRQATRASGCTHADPRAYRRAPATVLRPTGPIPLHRRAGHIRPPDHRRASSQSSKRPAAFNARASIPTRIAHAPWHARIEHPSHGQRHRRPRFGAESDFAQRSRSPSALPHHRSALRPGPPTARPTAPPAGEPHRMATAGHQPRRRQGRPAIARSPLGPATSMVGFKARVRATTNPPAGPPPTPAAALRTTGADDLDLQGPRIAQQGLLE